MGFSKLALSENIQKTLREEGYETPTPIQAEAIPHVLAGRDVLGIAQTGTGKTAAFALPIIHRLLDPSTRKAAPAGHAPAVEPHAALDGHHEGGVAKPQAAAEGSAESLISKSARKTRALILSPTRELAGQIEESFRTYGRGTPLRVAVIFGGVSQDPQVKALRHGVDVVVATPGRLLDLINQGLVDLRHVRTFVLDEADQM
ncbi:MAG TPA: DEAD/DEAH box helicase, partial [Tepidisphaeraceae bacterium]|nr:DEAD/DEAH box helicase [Tepidisphaeraceae bacterium]